MCQQDSGVTPAKATDSSSEVAFHNFWRSSDQKATAKEKETATATATAETNSDVPVYNFWRRKKNQQAQKPSSSSNNNVSLFWNHPDPQYNTLKLSLPKPLQNQIIKHGKRLAFRQKAKKAAVTVGGSTLVGMGTVLMFTPIHPLGHLMQAGGVGVLATEYDSMKKHKETAGKRIEQGKQKAAELFSFQRKKEDDVLERYYKQDSTTTTQDQLIQQILDQRKQKQQQQRTLKHNNNNNNNKCSSPTTTRRKL